MDDIKVRQQVVDKIKKATNILVTVSNDPSVDALSAALALTLLVDKLDKHATAVFSGIIPPAIAFLEPEKTFEKTTDSLRDFIIALDKEKADHLRYKVDGDVVKIFITPYRTTITGDDLQFSQGDFNVELVIALGVDNQDHLDAALDAHGKILHDASVITITAGKQTSSLGTTDWHDEKASGLSEMITDLADALKEKDSLVDKQVATAILTGIVAQTDRFSNPFTTAKTMTVAANLMAAGADQQLIAAKLEESHEIDAQPASAPDSAELKEDQSTKVKKPKDGSLQIAHEEKSQTDSPVDTSIHQISDVHSNEDAPLSDHEPSIGGTLNATADQAADDARHQKNDDQNNMILSHHYVGDASSPDQAMSGAEVPENTSDIVDPLTSQTAPISAYAPEPELPTTPPADQPASAPAAPVPQPAAVPLPEPAPAPAAPVTPASVGLPMPPPLPPLPDFSAPTAVAPSSTEVAPQPERLGDILAPEPPAGPSPAAPAPDPTVANDPAQFKIPGQS